MEFQKFLFTKGYKPFRYECFGGKITIRENYNNEYSSLSNSKEINYTYMVSPDYYNVIVSNSCVNNFKMIPLCHRIPIGLCTNADYPEVIIAPNGYKIRDAKQFSDTLLLCEIFKKGFLNYDEKKIHDIIKDADKAYISVKDVQGIIEKYGCEYYLELLLSLDNIIIDDSANIIKRIKLK